MYIVDFFDHKQSNYHLVMEVVGYKDKVNVTYLFHFCQLYIQNNGNCKMDVV